MSVVNNLSKLKKHIPPDVKLIAVSKTKPIESILELYQSGHKVFGENRVQELTSKQSFLPNDIEWHFIGHLQTNKVKYIAPFISLIHSIDDLNLLIEVNKEAKKNNRVIDCLLEIYIATEESKYGLDYVEAIAILSSSEYKELQNIRICGIMGMATFTDDIELVRKEFKNLKAIFERIKIANFSGKPYFKEISMGMTGDYTIAIEEGSTMVRIGTAIFGDR